MGSGINKEDKILDEEKKILMDQLKELTKIVELKDEEIRQKIRKFENRNFRLRI